MSRRFVGTLVLVGALVAGCATSDFAKSVDPAAIQSALTAAGVQVCASGNVNWNRVPGFDSGTYFLLDTDCSGVTDSSNAGATVTLAKFDSVEARNAAQARFLTQYRRGPGIGAARTLGPYLITVDGHQNDGTVNALAQALSSLGAQ